MVSFEAITELGRRIAREFRPERIILFGSYASGAPHEGSDVDLLVVLPFQGKGVWKAIEILDRVNPSFPQLAESKAEIEQVFGGELDWTAEEGLRYCRIGKAISLGGYRDPEDKWPAIHHAMVDAMIRLEKALSPHIEKLKV